MSAAAFSTLDRILRLHEDELIEETLAGLPAFVLEQQPASCLRTAGLPSPDG
ncbi:MAG: hypothetical protein OEV61_08915 [Chloroflexota bacterium]|nr:hypothetical protein [Chloroflexota bacterium]